MSRRSCLLLLVALLVLDGSTAFAQFSVNIIGNVVIGRSGPPGTRLAVVVTTSIDVEVVRGFTDEQGKFRFYGLQAGDYKVLVKAPTGAKYRDGAAEVHVIPRLSGEQSVSVTIVLDSDSTETVTPESKGGTVAVDEIQTSIPKQAKKLYENGAKAAAAGRTEEAISHFRSALAIAPDYLFALNDLGSQLIKVDRLDDAIEVLRKATTISPKAYSPHMNLGMALLYARKFPEARTEMDAALAARPDEPTALFVSGQVHRALGNRDQAIAAFDHALLASSGTLVPALIQLGQLYEEKGDREAATRMYRTYLEAAPDGPAATQARARLDALGLQSPN